jgi:Peptidase M1 N-terminal domain
VLALAGAVACLAFPVPAAQAHVGTGAVASDPDVAQLEAAARTVRAGAPAGEPGAAGVGDPYFPLEGNGGYDVRHYDLSFSYDPATDRLDGTMAIRARATQDLSRFDLDLQQLEVSAVRVNDEPAGFTRDGQELQVTPHNRLRKGSTLNVAVDYGGVPQTIVGSPIVFGSPYGFLHTDDGAFMGDEPNVASTWMPVSDHPSDKATWTVRATVPEGKGVVANGRLVSQVTSNGKSTFVWDEPEQMATYLLTACIGNWVIKTGRTPGGIPETVAVDPTIIASRPDAVDFFYNTTAEATDLWTETFGPYPFDSTGAIADNATFNGQPLGFSLETQTRPVYSRCAPPARSRTRWRTCGSATASRSRTGGTSGSTKGSRPTRSTCGPSTWAARRRTTSSWRSSTAGRPATRSGTARSPTRSATRCSSGPSTGAA